ncbi:MAG: cysteine hydrolase [Anaerolineaceae bacterium]|nr:cysteine hydrolase [Anaerolineaceae bacterium]
MKKALLIIDVQNEYFPGGNVELHDSINTSLRIKEILVSCRKNMIPVIHVQHFATKPDAPAFAPGTRNVEIHENVKPLEPEKIISKNYPNSFRGTELEDHLKMNGISTLIVAGMMTHNCVESTVRAAYDLGYECIVAGDCCTTKSLKLNNEEIPVEYVQKSFLAGLNGRFSKVVQKDDVLKLISDING